MAAKRSITKEKVQLFEVLFPLLRAMYEEFKDLSRKKPEGVLSQSKIATVNRLLISCGALLEGEPSTDFLDKIDEVNVPQYSDVVITLSQYVAAMQQFRSKYSESDLIGQTDWLTRGS